MISVKVIICGLLFIAHSESSLGDSSSRIKRQLAGSGPSGTCYYPSLIEESAADTGSSVKKIQHYVDNVQNIKRRTTDSSIGPVRSLFHSFNSAVDQAKRHNRQWKTGGNSIFNAVNYLYGKALGLGSWFDAEYKKVQGTIEDIKRKAAPTSIDCDMKQGLQAFEDCMKSKYGIVSELKVLEGFLQKVLAEAEAIIGAAHTAYDRLEGFARNLAKDKATFASVDKSADLAMLTLNQEIVKNSKELGRLEQKQRQQHQEFHRLEDDYRLASQKYDRDLAAARKKKKDLQIAGAVLIWMPWVGVPLLAASDTIKQPSRSHLDQVKRNLEQTIREWNAARKKADRHKSVSASLSTNREAVRKLARDVDSILLAVQDAISSIGSLKTVMCQITNYLSNAVEHTKQQRDLVQQKKFIELAINGIRANWQQAFGRVLRFQDFVERPHQAPKSDLRLARERVKDLIQGTNNPLKSQHVQMMARVLAQSDARLWKFAGQEVSLNLGPLMNHGQCVKTIIFLNSLVDLPCGDFATAEDTCSATYNQQTSRHLSAAIQLGDLHNLVEALRNYRLDLPVNDRGVASLAKYLCFPPMINREQNGSMYSCAKLMEGNTKLFPKLEQLCRSNSG